MSNQTKRLSLPARLVVLVIGFGGMLFLFVGSINWDGIQGWINISIAGKVVDITRYVIGSIIVLVAYVAGSLFKSGLRGRWSLD